jgi:hypothetical protein
MTFEQKLKEILKVDLGAIFGYETEHRMIVSVANDVASDRLDYDNSLLAIIKTGQGLRSSTPGFDNVQLPLTINFYFQRNFLPTFLSEINEYIKVKNAVGFATEIDLETVYYKIGYTSPFVMQGNSTWHIKGSGVTLEMAQVTLMAECLYSTQVEYNQPIIKFNHNGIEYDIKNVLRYSINSEPATDAYKPIGASVTKKPIISYESSISIGVAKIKNDAFINIIIANFVTPIDQTLPMSIVLNGSTYLIQKVSISEVYEGGISSYEIVFLR